MILQCSTARCDADETRNDDDDDDDDGDDGDDAEDASSHRVVVVVRIVVHVETETMRTRWELWPRHLE